MTGFLAKDFSVLHRTELNTLGFHAARASPTFAAKLGSVCAHLATRPLWALYRVAMKAPCVSIGHWKGNQIAREDTTRLQSCITLDITWLGSRLFLWKVSFLMLFASPSHACKTMACSKQQQRSKQFLCHTSARGSGYNHCIFHLSYPPGQNQSSFVLKHLDYLCWLLGRSIYKSPKHPKTQKYLRNDRGQCHPISSSEFSRVPSWTWQFQSCPCHSIKCLRLPDITCTYCNHCDMHYALR